LSITNTMMTNVMERTGEIGTSMALGLPRRGILMGFIVEGVMLGLIGAIVGVALGIALALLISKIGIPMPPPPGLSRAFIGEILVTGELARDAVLLAFGTTIIASIYPAWKASRLVIVGWPYVWEVRGARPVVRRQRFVFSGQPSEQE